MSSSFKNIRDVAIVENSPNGPIYSCTIDLYIEEEDLITGETFIHPDSGSVEYIAHPDDKYGFGPRVYSSIENGDYTGEIKNEFEG